MLQENELSFEQAAAFIRNFPRQDRDFSRLHSSTYDYLRADKQKLQAEQDQAVRVGQTERVTHASRRLEYYYLVEDFFLYLAEQGCAITLSDMTLALVETFLHRQRPATQYKPLKQALIPSLTDKRAQHRERTELKAFVDRAEQEQVIRVNLAPLPDKTSRKLRPTQLSFRSMADCQAFEKFLAERVERTLLSPHTPKLYYRHLRTLLHDAEVQHAGDPQRPTELTVLFAEPHWVATWLQALKNRSIHTHSEVMASRSVGAYLLSVRHFWLFLKAQGRAAPDYYPDLKEMLRLDHYQVWLAGRRARGIEALSEVEEETVLHCITTWPPRPCCNCGIPPCLSLPWKQPCGLKILPQCAEPMDLPGPSQTKRGQE